MSKRSIWSSKFFKVKSFLDPRGPQCPLGPQDSQGPQGPKGPQG